MKAERKTGTFAIRIRGLRKRFVLHHHGGSIKRAVMGVFRSSSREVIEVLHGIDLEIPHGETVALIGRNGSGKSTLLGLIARVYLPTAGKIERDGKVAPLLELGAGFHPDLTGEENAELYGAILGMSGNEIRQKLPSIVDFGFDRPDLASKIDTPLRNYSDGMKMRLGFAVAIHTDPEILLFDEVLAVGDEAFQHKCYRKIEELQRAGKTIIFVSHDMHVVQQVATRVVWLHEGAIRMDGPVAKVVPEYIRSSEAPPNPLQGESDAPPSPS